MKLKTFSLLFLIATLASCQLRDDNPNSSKKTDVSQSNNTTENIIPDDVLDDGPQTDPYVNVTAKQFYADYSPATTYMDSYYRTQHNFMSGSIEPQLQRPTIAENQPMEGKKYVFNSKSGLRSDGNVYDIVNKNGKVVNRIFKGGAYVTLEEVAAYVYAFGDTPANYTAAKKTKPSTSPWGNYLRLNHSYFNGDTTRYKYETELPDLNDKRYYEIDIGTTGSFEYSTSGKGEYNNGHNIIRGASRIVYTRYLGNSLIERPEDRKVFYTFNHYNDFQEYLNYENGWGKWFGNVAGGGQMDNNTGVYKTDYPEVIKKDFR